MPSYRNGIGINIWYIFGKINIPLLTLFKLDLVWTVKAAGLLVGTECRNCGHFLNIALEKVGGETTEKSLWVPLVLIINCKVVTLVSLQGGPSSPSQPNVCNRPSCPYGLVVSHRLCSESRVPGHFLKDPSPLNILATPWLQGKLQGAVCGVPTPPPGLPTLLMPIVHCQSMAH